jgi:alpha-1,3-rhamnosyl/mannosyltransferase
MIRVGIDATTWYNERGFGRFTREMVKALARRRSKFSYTLVLDREPDREFPVEVLAHPTARTVTQAAVGEGHRSISDMLSLSRAVAKAKFDLFFFPAVYSYFPLLSRTPCVVCFHDTIAERHPELTFPTKRNALFWNLKSRLAKLQSARVMTVSEASAWDLSLVLGVPRERIDVVTEAADPVFRVVEAPRRSVLVYVGGLNPHKNLIGLLRAMPAVLAKRPDVELAIVGDTSKRGFYDNVDELTNAVERDPILKRAVRFTGFLSDEELVLLLNGATALVLPSLLEGFGLPAVEAMACGLPVVASRRGSLPEVIGDAGLFFDPLSSDDISRAILRLVEDPALQADLRTRALARAATFTWERGAQLAEGCFEKCVGK